jgi:hypothetical protein
VDNVLPKHQETSTTLHNITCTEEDCNIQLRRLKSEIFKTDMDLKVFGLNPCLEKGMVMKTHKRALRYL